VPKFVLVSSTTAKQADARRIARVLVERRLAACVQVLGPIKSTYRWQGRVETASEWLCLAKTTVGRSRKLVAAVTKLHTYDTPELIVTPITGGSRRYLDWLAASVRPSAKK
jgi:periplasmic divalent cation tolerance protein